MSTRMKRIVISQRHTIMGNKGWVDYLENTYVDFFSSFGVTVFPLPNPTADFKTFVRTVRPDGIVLCGGEDVSPSLYGGAQELSSNCSIIRDETEEQLLKFALKSRVPVLGICRGMQYLNVFFGGSVQQQIQSVPNSGEHVPVGKHSVQVSLPSQYATKQQRTLYSKKFTVNSFHNQGVVFGGLGSGVHGFASVPNTEMVEGIYHERYPVAGIEWHPERHSYSKILDRFLIDSFLKKKLFWGQ